MRIESDVYLIASGQMGFDLTDPYDCNVFLFDAGDVYFAFDAGAGRGTAQLLSVCERDGLDAHKFKHLFLTHAHGDHAGGAANLHEQCGVEVYAGEATARIVARGDEDAVSLQAARAVGVYPADFVYRACPVAHVLAPAQVVQLGRFRIEAIATPGHSHDHTSYLVSGDHKRYLVSGDAIFFGGKVVWQNTYDCSVPQTNASIQHLARYDFEALLPGHLNFSLQRGKRHVQAALTLIEKLGCPQSIV